LRKPCAVIFRQSLARALHRNFSIIRCSIKHCTRDLWLIKGWLLINFPL
jgi:hypothetical protein